MAAEMQRTERAMTTGARRGSARSPEQQEPRAETRGTEGCQVRRLPNGPRLRRGREGARAQGRHSQVVPTRPFLCSLAPAWRDVSPGCPWHPYSRGHKSLLGLPREHSPLACVAE